MTATDIQALLRGMRDITPKSGGKDLKFAEQAPFSGKPEDLENLLREAEVRFSVQNDVYNTPTKKAYYVLFLFKTGNAKLWKEQYIRQRVNKTLCEGGNFATFIQTLLKNFQDSGSADDAMQQLQTVTQGNRSVDEYNTRFRILIQKAGLDDQDNARILCQMYSKGLKKDIARQIMIQEPPTTLSGWMTKASTLDSYVRRANNFFSNAVSQPRKPWKPRQYVAKENHGEPMDID